MHKTRKLASKAKSGDKHSVEILLLLAPAGQKGDLSEDEYADKLLEDDEMASKYEEESGDEMEDDEDDESEDTEDEDTSEEDPLGEAISEKLKYYIEDGDDLTEAVAAVLSCVKDGE